MTGDVSHPWLQHIMEAELSPASKRQYVHSLQMLQSLMRGMSFQDILKSPEITLPRIKMQYTNPQTQKALISGIKAAFKHVPGLKDKFELAYNVWHEQAKELQKDILDRVATAVPTETEVEKWVVWPEILAKVHELAKTQYASLDHLVLAMYSLMEPMRADFGKVRILDSPPPPDDFEENHIVFTNPSMAHLIMKSYKTSAKYGEYRRMIPEELTRIIYASIMTTPRHYLFIDESGKPYDNKNSFGKFVNRTLAKIFGRSVTIRILRHSFISNIDFNTTTPAQLMEYSRNMLHSISQQQLYRRKVPSGEPPAPPQVILQPHRHHHHRRRRHNNRRRRHKPPSSSHTIDSHGVRYVVV